MNPVLGMYRAVGFMHAGHMFNPSVQQEPLMAAIAEAEADGWKVSSGGGSQVSLRRKDELRIITVSSDGRLSSEDQYLPARRILTQPDW